MSEASGHRGLWTEAKYPGDAVRILMLYRRDERGRIELGDIRIQDYGNVLRVGAFLPGECECSPGDTPKTFPRSSNTTGPPIRATWLTGCSISMCRKHTRTAGRTITPSNMGD